MVLAQESPPLLRGPRGGARWRPSPNCPSGRQRPADEQNFANFPTQIWLFVRKPSLMTVSLMLALVTATGVSSTDGVCTLPVFVSSGPLGVWPFASAIATLAAASDSFLTAL